MQFDLLCCSRVSESSTASQEENRQASDRGDATPTSEDDHCGGGGEASSSSSCHPGGAVSLSAAMARISSQPSGPGPGSARSQSHATPTPATPQALSPLALPPPITLTPSLARLYKEPLIGHVLAWPAEQVERGCCRISEEAHQLASHGITKVGSLFTVVIQTRSLPEKCLSLRCSAW